MPATHRYFIKKTLQNLLADHGPGDSGTHTQSIVFGAIQVPVVTSQFWTARQRQSANLHEVAYRACFKPALPHFFIQILSEKNDTIYDPFSGRGTTVLEAALHGRRVILNDINPLSRILTEPRINLPTEKTVFDRLESIPIVDSSFADEQLDMFYHPDTMHELMSLRQYLADKRQEHTEDNADKWIRMVATNRLTGHSPGFFSVYTLPPNQALSRDRQVKINKQRQQQPSYRPVKQLIMRKTKQLLKGLSKDAITYLHHAADTALFLNNDAAHTPAIGDDSVQLTITSPPFLDVVQYSHDNWLRCWFNQIDTVDVAKNITMSKTIGDWSHSMQQVFYELYRITKQHGYVAFEVGEVRKGKVKLEEAVVPLGVAAGFTCICILINEQTFTKTANIWGVANNTKGTNTNRVVVFQKIT